MRRLVRKLCHLATLISRQRITHIPSLLPLHRRKAVFTSTLAQLPKNLNYHVLSSCKKLFVEQSLLLKSSPLKGTLNGNKIPMSTRWTTRHMRAMAVRTKKMRNFVVRNITTWNAAWEPEQSSPLCYHTLSPRLATRKGSSYSIWKLLSWETLIIMYLFVTLSVNIPTKLHKSTVSIIILQECADGYNIT